jgi:tripartite ATP-independent transporter DctP family solute receptor
MNPIRRSLCLAVAALLPLAAGAQDFKERTLKFAFANLPEHPQGQGAKRFAELVSTKTGGKTTVKLFGNATLGGDLQTLSALQGGTVEVTVMNAGLLAGVIKDFEAFDLPFLFNTPQEADAVVDGPFGQKMLAKLDAKGLVGLAYWDLGFRALTNSRRPVTKVEDVAGLKVRVVQAPMYQDLFNALGANAVPLPFAEAYTALEQKAVDGQENAITVIASAKYNEVQKYMTLTRHMYNPQVVMVSRKTWDGLSEGEKKALRDAAQEATGYQRQASRDAVAKAIDALKKGGMEVTELSPQELARFRDKAKPVVDKHTATIGADTVKELYAEVAKVRK